MKALLRFNDWLLLDIYWKNTDLFINGFASSEAAYLGFSLDEEDISISLYMMKELDIDKSKTKLR